MPTDNSTSGSTQQVTCDACGRVITIAAPAATSTVTCECGRAIAIVAEALPPLPTDLKARGEELRRRAKANKKPRRLGRELAMMSWAMPLLAMFASMQVARGFPSRPPGTRITDPLERYLPMSVIAVGALIGIIAAIAALYRVKKDGPKGILGHAIFGLLANAIVVGLFVVGAMGGFRQ